MEQKLKLTLAKFLVTSSKGVDQYLDTALWTTPQEDKDGKSKDEFLDSEYSIQDFSDKARKQAEKDIQQFWKKAESKGLDNLLDHLDLEDTGHNFWLSRNGFMSAFEDKYGDEFKPLDDLAREFKNIRPYYDKESEELEFDMA